MGNISQMQREEMLKFLNALREQHKDDASLVAINKIENALNEKKYGLVWEKHIERVDEMLEDNIPVFTEVESRKISVNPKEPYNFLLEGDNLHSLKLLEKTHAGKIDVIYIDPPYNTGNKDFKYNDEFVDKNDTYAHSKWLSFIEERLKSAKRLMSDHGIIFISINKFEYAQLKLLADEIFGEFNLLGILTWESTTQPINAGISKFQIQQKCEFVYVYAKNKDIKSTFILDEKEGLKKYPHMGKYGPCRFEIIEKSDSGRYKRDSMRFEILGQQPRKGKRWQIGIETAKILEKNGRLEIVDGIVKKAVYPQDEDNKRSYSPFWSHLDSDSVGTAQSGKDELNSIFNQSIGFDTVKPVSLIKKLLRYCGPNTLILDFFAGSGTTGHAVAALNKEDGGKRQYILCTNNENKICEEITYQRLKNIQKELPHNLKYYRTDFVPKFSEDNLVEEELLGYIKELIELQYGHEIDNKHMFLVTDEDEFDEVLTEDAGEGIKVFITSDILLTSKQEILCEQKHIEVISIPEYYYRNELIEVGEI